MAVKDSIYNAKPKLKINFAKEHLDDLVVFVLTC